MCVRSFRVFGKAALCGGWTSVLTALRKVFSPLHTCMPCKYFKMVLFMRSAKFWDKMSLSKFKSNLWSAFQCIVLTLERRPDFCNVNSGRAAKSCSPRISGTHWNFFLWFSPIGWGAQAHFCWRWCLVCCTIISQAHEHSKWWLTDRMYLGSHDTNEKSANIRRKPPCFVVRKHGKTSVNTLLVRVSG